MVIIGLIIGGILVGQSLIQQARVKSTMSDILAYNTAVSTFYAKYQAIPGDFNQAANFIVGATNGNGDGLIGDTSSQNPPLSLGLANAGCPFIGLQTEVASFWYQLYASNLIKDSGYSNYVANDCCQYPLQGFPATAFSDKAGVIAYGNTRDSVNYYHIGVVRLFFTGIETANILSSYDAYAIDQKIDDGIANTGMVGARGGTTGVESSPSLTGTTGPSTAGGCVILGSGTFAASYNVPLNYNTAASGAQCQLRIRMN
jgi:hypothetical protein